MVGRTRDGVEPGFLTPQGEPSASAEHGSRRRERKGPAADPTRQNVRCSGAVHTLVWSESGVRLRNHSPSGRAGSVCEFRVAEWTGAGVKRREVLSWRRAGFDRGISARPWASLGIGPDDAGAFRAAKWHILRAAKWNAEGISAYEAFEWDAHNFLLDAAARARLLHLGPVEATSWYQLCDEEPREKWSWRHDSNLRPFEYLEAFEGDIERATPYVSEAVRRTVSHKRELAWLADVGVSPSDTCTWLDAVLPTTALDLLERRVPLEFVTAFVTRWKPTFSWNVEEILCSEFPLEKLDDLAEGLAALAKQSDKEELERDNWRDPRGLRSWPARILGTTPSISDIQDAVRAGLSVTELLERRVSWSDRHGVVGIFTVSTQGLRIIAQERVQWGAEVYDLDLDGNTFRERYGVRRGAALRTLRTWVGTDVAAHVAATAWATGDTYTVWLKRWTRSGLSAAHAEEWYKVVPADVAHTLVDRGFTLGFVRSFIKRHRRDLERRDYPWRSPAEQVRTNIDVEAVLCSGHPPKALDEFAEALVEYWSSATSEGDWRPPDDWFPGHPFAWETKFFAAKPTIEDIRNATRSGASAATLVSYLQSEERHPK